jgi:hypothetical protein
VFVKDEPLPQDGCCLKEIQLLPGLWSVELGLQVPLEVLTPDLYVAPKLDTGDLPTLYVPVDPTLAHPEFLADVGNREEIEAVTVSLAGLGALWALFLVSEVLFELYERVFQLF